MKTGLFFFFILLFVFSIAQPVYFNNRLDFQYKWDGATNIIAADSDYIIIGETGDSIYDNFRFLAIQKINKNGNAILKKQYGSLWNNLYSGMGGNLIPVLDGGYAMAITREDSISTMGMLWRFNDNLDTLWTIKYTGLYWYNSLVQCKRTTDSGFILIGTKDISGNGNDNIWLVKTDKNGNLQWQKTYGGGGVEYGFSVDVCMDGGYILGGYTNSFGAGGYDTYIIKTNSSGSKLWDKTYGGIYDDNGAYIIQTADSGFFICTAIEKYKLGPNAYKQSYLIKTDSTGSIEWDKTYGPIRYATSAIVCSQFKDGNFVVIGQQLNKDSIALSGNAQGFIMKVNSNGDSLWYRVYEYDSCEKNDDYFRDMKPTSDGGFIVAGFFTPNTSIQCNDTGTQDMWVIKLDSCGCAYLGCDSACQGLVGEAPLNPPQRGTLITLYPNPNEGKFTIISPKSQDPNFKYKGNAESEITIFDLLGKNILSMKSAKEKTEVDISGFDAGIYLIKIINDESNYIDRIVKY